MEENKNLQNQNQEQKSAAEILLNKLEQRKKEKKDSIEDLKQLQNQIIHEAATEEQVEDVEAAEKETYELDENINQLPDYSKYSREELVAALEELLNDINEKNLKIGNIIKDVYYTKRNKEIAEARIKFEEEGGVGDFVFEDNLEEKFKQLYEKYKEKRNEINQRKEAEIKRNTERKLEIIDEIEKLIEKGEALKTTFDEFYKLKEEWEKLGPVEPQRNKEIVEKYDYTLQKFYNWVKINKELRDFDLRKNLEQKLRLCEEAEALLIEPRVVKAYKKFLLLKQRWYNIGPVPNEHKEDILTRFREVEKIINKKHYDYFQNLRQQQNYNLKAKELLCEEAEKIANGEYQTSAEWKKKNEELDELLKLWRMIGFAPKKYNNSIFERFINARKLFFERKRNYFKDYFDDLEANYQKKLEIVKKAEENKDIADFKEGTRIFLDLQKQWKSIGPVPNAKKDEIWNKFNEICNYFFNRKREFFAQKENEEKQNLTLKLELLEKLKKFEFEATPEESLKKLQDIQNRWSQIGYVPSSEKDKIYSEYKQALDKIYEKLNVSKVKLQDSETSSISLEEKVQKLLQTSDKPANKIRNEIDKVRNKIASLNADIVKLENNMTFFVKSKSAEGILKNFRTKIDRLNSIKAENEKYLHLLLKAYNEVK